jgi:hypothetical protein
MKVVINNCYQGCLLSEEAVQELMFLGFQPSNKNYFDLKHNWKSVLPFVYNSDLDNLERHDPRLISVLEKLGQNAETYLSKFIILPVETNKKYKIILHPMEKKEKLIYVKSIEKN